MKAILCEAFGPPESLKFGELPSRAPGDHEVLIEVKAAGVNFPDTLIVQGLYQFQPEFPFAPGGEVAGIIKQVGAKVSHLQPGDAVIAGTGWGGFAQEVVVPAENTFPKPHNLSFEEAAGIVETYGTAYHALVDRANLKKEETMLVLGAAGGTGTAALQIGKALGAKVIAAASTQEKLDYCLANGADLTINYQEEDLKNGIKAVTQGKGVDVVFDPVGDKFAEPALRATAWGGRYLVIGFAGGQIPKIPLNLPLLKGNSIVGVFWGGFFRHQPQQNVRNFVEITKMFEEGLLKQQLEGILPLEKAAEALRMIMERKVRGKLVLKVE